MIKEARFNAKLYKLINPNTYQEYEGWRWKIESAYYTMVSTIIFERKSDSIRSLKYFAAKYLKIKNISYEEDTWYNADFLV